MPEAEHFPTDATRYIEMPGGRRFYIDNPEFRIDDIAYGLGGQPRFNALAIRNEHDHYINVAEHSVRASYMILDYSLDELADNFTFTAEEELRRVAALTALMHDAPEAYIGDMPAPWKSLLPDYRNLEHAIWRQIVDWVAEEFVICMPYDLPALMKEVDWRCLFVETRECVQSQGKGWVKFEEYAPTLADPACYWWSPTEAEHQFLRRFHELTTF